MPARFPVRCPVPPWLNSGSDLLTEHADTTMVLITNEIAHARAPSRQIL